MEFILGGSPLGIVALGEIEEEAAVVAASLLFMAKTMRGVSRR